MNTVKAEKKAERAFVNYLSTLDDVDDMEFWLYDEDRLDKILSKFWFALKTANGNHYRVSSLKNIRYGLNRVLAKKNTNMDIICDPLFKQSQKDCLCLLETTQIWIRETLQRNQGQR